LFAWACLLHTLFATHSSKGLATVKQTGWTVLIPEIGRTERQAAKFLDMQDKLHIVDKTDLRVQLT